MKSIEELTGLYSLSKTLRFELKPIGKTLEQIERKGLLTQDEQRSEEYERIEITEDQTKQCPKCGHRINFSSAVCPYCGKEFQ